MTITFERPGGAAADVRELEYISALHQTCMPTLRRDGSIQDVDVSHFLKSRHGIDVTPEEIRRTVFKGMGGGDEEGECIDLAELVALLLIPELIKAAQARRPRGGSTPGGGSDVSSLADSDDDTHEDHDDDNYDEHVRRRRVAGSLSPPPGIIGSVLDMIMQDVGSAGGGGGFAGTSDDADGDEESSSAVATIDGGLVRDMFLAYGEDELAADEGLIRDMVAAARPGDDSEDDEANAGAIVFDEEAFGRALTKDVRDGYDVESDLHATTHYFDVFKEHRRSMPALCGRGTCPPCKNKKNETGKEKADSSVHRSTREAESGDRHPSADDSSTTRPDDAAANANADADGGKAKYKSIFTFPSIDFVADTFRSKTIVVLLWTFLLVHLLASGSFGLQDFPHLVPTEIEACQEDPSFLCTATGTFLVWVDRVFTLTVVGGIVVVGVGSAGNSTGTVSRLSTLISLAPVVYFVVKPFTHGTSPSEQQSRGYHLFYAVVVYFIVAAVLIVLRVRDLLCLPSTVTATISRTGSGLRGFFTGGGGVHSEAYIKQAASHKVNRMMMQAEEISRVTEDDRATGTRFGRALLDFLKMGESLEEAGGYRWTWKQLRSRDLFYKEGIVFSSRMLAGNVIQVVIAGYILLYFVFGMQNAMNTLSQIGTTVVVATTGGMSEFLFSGLKTNMNGLANGTIDMLYGGLFPAIDRLKNESCDEVLRLNATEFEDMCSGVNNLDGGGNLESIADLCRDLDVSNASGLVDFCASANKKGSSYDGNELVANVCSESNATAFADLVNACVGINSFRFDAALAATLCAGSDGLDTMQELCSAGTNYTLEGGIPEVGLPSRDTLKALVGVSLTQSVDSFERFVRTSIQSGAQMVNRIVLLHNPIQPWMITTSYSLGAILSFVSSLFLASIYIPSATSTTLQFRSGVLPSLQDPNFVQYRRAVQQVTLILGGMFWGTLFYCGGIAFIVTFGLLIIFVVFNVLRSSDGDGTIAGVLVGSIYALVVQMVLFSLCGCATYRAFYRNRPASANLFGLMWESAWLGLTIFFVIIRMIKLIVLAVLEVGRMDTPFLAEGVGEFFRVKMDNYPYIFRKDILSHEAHRHPYIERLGKIYLLKLRNGDKFGRTSGSCWRLLFVFALMPWMRKYRVMARPELGPKEGDNGHDVDSELRTVALAPKRLSTALMRQASKRTPEGGEMNQAQPNSVDLSTENDDAQETKMGFEYSD